MEAQRAGVVRKGRVELVGLRDAAAIDDHPAPGGSQAAHPPEAALPQSGGSAGAATVPACSGRAPGPPSACIGPCCHCLRWPAALRPPPAGPCKPSGPGRAPRGRGPTDGPPSLGALGCPGRARPPRHGPATAPDAAPGPCQPRPRRAPPWRRPGSPLGPARWSLGRGAPGPSLPVRPPPP